MTKEELKELGEKIGSGTASQEEVLAFIKALQEEVSAMSLYLEIND